MEITSIAQNIFDELKEVEKELISIMGPNM